MSIYTAAVADTYNSPKDLPRYDSWKKGFQKYKAKSNMFKALKPKFTDRCTCLSGFIHVSSPKHTNECIKMTLDIEKYSGKIYGTEAIKVINEFNIKLGT